MTRKDAWIQRARGHATHFHVRFRDPSAEQLGRQMTRLLPPAPPKRL